MQNILVTGGSGFIGSHLCEKLLESGYHVINIDNFNEFYDPVIKKNNIVFALQNSNYKLYVGDINDNQILDTIFKSHNIDTVVHLAALAGVRQSLLNPLSYIDTDIKGTVNILEYCKNYKVSKLIFASSSSVYGKNPSPFRESDPLDMQVSPYAAAKRSGEIFCQTYNELYNIPIICLRFFTVYGPRQRPEMAISSFTKLINEQHEISVYGDGFSARDYTYIDDIIDGIIASVKYKCKFEIFNLGKSDVIYLNDLIKIIEKRLGKISKIKYECFQSGDVEKTFADLTKSKTLLNYNPKISIEDGIDKYIKWYKVTNAYNMVNI